MRPWTAIFFVVVFVSGALSGFFVGRAQPAPRSTDLPRWKDTLEAYDREVGLDAGQRASFEKIFTANHPRFNTVKRTIEPELATLRSDVRTQLRAVLREEQRPRFDQYCSKRDRQRDESMR
jgi:hypothetical protein